MVFFLHGVDTPCEDPKKAIQRVGHRVRLLDDGKQEALAHGGTRSEKRVSADRVKRILLRKCTTVSVHPNWNCLRSGGLEQACVELVGVGVEYGVPEVSRAIFAPRNCCMPLRGVVPEVRSEELMRRQKWVVRPRTSVFRSI